MKKIALLFSFLSLTFICTVTYAGEISQSDPLFVEIQDGAIFPFFTALKEGDINAIKRYVSSDMYSKYKRLLEDNKEYPKFLRDHYRGTKFRMERTTENDNHVVVDVMIEFPNGYRRINKLRVLKERNGLQGRNRSKRWRISEQALDRAHYSSGNVSSVE